MMERLELIGKDLRIILSPQGTLSVVRGGRTVWETSGQHIPEVTIRSDGASKALPLASAAESSARELADGPNRGRVLRLAGYGTSDVVIELALALDEATNDLLVQVEQVGGRDVVEEVNHLYCFEKPVAAGGAMVLPHGSGYLIPAECPDELPGAGPAGGQIGASWSMPLFGMIKGDEAWAAIVESWWDCHVYARHRPGDASELDFRWTGSLGRLAYPRRIRLRFARNWNHVAMAKWYRQHAKAQGLVRTLKEKMEQTPQIQRYLEGVLFRFAAWNPAQVPSVLEQLGKLSQRGIKVNLFYPKWPSAGYSEETNTANTSDGAWQGHLQATPVPGGWPALLDFSNRVRQIDCLMQGFGRIITQRPEAPGYDADATPMSADGQRKKHVPWVSAARFAENTRIILQSLKRHGLGWDVLYYDGTSAFQMPPEDFTSGRQVSRRQIFENENASLAETRRAGIMPGGELARFWAMRDCDYWFYTDWASDRLCNTPVKGCPKPAGEPIPLFQLVFHDCYMAGFSGGGYALYAPGYDWWQDRTPRLYELLYVAMPCHNWLPNGAFPYDRIDDPAAQPRWDWLRKMSALCQATKHSEMSAHEFTGGDARQQRIAFANGVEMELDMAGNRYRVRGVEGFTGQWEPAPLLT